MTESWAAWNFRDQFDDLRIKIVEEHRFPVGHFTQEQIDWENWIQIPSNFLEKKTQNFLEKTITRRGIELHTMKPWLCLIILLISVESKASLGSQSQSSDVAYATLLYGDEFLLGVRVLGKSIRDTGSKQDMVVLVSDGVSDYANHLLQVHSSLCFFLCKFNCWMHFSNERWNSHFITVG